MKKIFLAMLILVLHSKTFAQVSIGKPYQESSAILDFGTGNKGLLLSVVTSLPNNPANGTIIMDGNSNELKIKVFENNIWKDLSDKGSLSTQSISGISTTTPVNQNTTSDIGKGIVIGNTNSNGEAASGVEGILVLEATDKAIVLPKVDKPHLNIKSPRAGTICYDTSSNTVSIFDGIAWNYWK